MPKHRYTLSAEFVRSVLSYSPDTGEFLWRYRSDMPRNWNGRHANKIAGSIKTTCGHRIIIINYKPYFAGPLAWIYMTGKWPETLVDHRNGNRADDKWNNLRKATDTTNAQNQHRRNDNTSGFKGVTWDKDGKRWRARITQNGTRITLGRFESLSDAYAAYCAAARQLFGEYARFE